MDTTFQYMKSQTVQSEVTGELMYVNFEDRNDMMDCSYEMADSIGKTEEYFVSRRLDRECAKTIDEALHDYYDYGTNILDEHVIEPVFQKFCPERIKNILANSVINEITPPENEPEFWDKRYRENKDWIKENASQNEEQRLTQNYSFDAHPTLINAFISLFRKETANLEQIQQDLSAENGIKPEDFNFGDIKSFYPGSFEHAKEHGETDLFRKSDQLNKLCASQMDSEIEDSWDGMRAGINAVYPVLENYCPDRVSRVLADTILYEAGDGRISSENKDWAKSIRPDWDEKHPDDHIRVLSIHPDKLDQFTGIYRQALPKFNEMEDDWKKSNGIMDNPVNETKAEGVTGKGFQLSDASMEDRHHFCTDMDAIEAAFKPEEGLVYAPSKNERAQKVFGEFSHKLSVICKDEIEAAIINDPAEREYFQQTNEPILEDGVAAKVAENFCPERIGHILSETILSKESMNLASGFSDENIAWAKEQPMHVPNRYSSAYLANGVANYYLNEFVNHFRSEVLQEDLTKTQIQNRPDEKQPVESESERASPPGR